MCFTEYIGSLKMSLTILCFQGTLYWRSVKDTSVTQCNEQP